MIFTITASPCLDRVLHLSEDKVEPGTMRVLAQDERPGGKGIDVSRAVQALQGETIAIAPLGPETGEKVKALVRMEGLDISEVAIGRVTRTNFILVTPNGDEYRINTKAPAFEASEIARFFDHIFKTVKPRSYVTIGGSTPDGFTCSWCQTIIRELKSKECHIALDTTAEVTKSCLAGRDSHPDIIKPNLIEFHDFLKFARLPGYNNGLLTDEDVHSRQFKKLGAEGFLEWKYTDPDGNPSLSANWRNLIDACAKFFEHYDAKVTPIVSLGRQGVLMADAGNRQVEILHAYHPLPVKVIARVGAGDSLLGAFLLSLERKRTKPDALNFAVSAATVRVSMTVEQERLSYIDAELVDEKLNTGAIKQDKYFTPCTADEPAFLSGRMSARPVDISSLRPA